MLYGSFFMSEIISKTIEAVKQGAVYLVVCAVAFAVCGVAGVVFSVNSEDVLLSDSASVFLEIVFTPSASVWSYAFSKLIGGAGILAVVTLCGVTVWLVPVHVLIIGYFAFVSGVAAVAFYAALSVVGVSFYVLILLPSTVIRAGAIALISINLIRYYKERRNLKKENCNAKIEIGKLFSFYAAGLIVYFCAVLFESVFLTVILRPINIYF